MDENSEVKPIYNTCPACGQLIDVSSQEPFTKVKCPHCGNALRVRCDFDHFLLKKKIGEGGMSRVFLAEDLKLQRQVALKILNQTYGGSAERIAQFEREAQLTAAINHPNVVRVYSVGDSHGYFYIAMELVGGGSFEEKIKAHGRLSELDVLRLGSAIGQGLTAAHKAGLVHRDIKPGNILFSEDGTPKIVDFGLALVTQDKDTSGEIWATPYYVPPEKLFDEPDDFRGDMYSLGASLFHGLTGHPPYAANTTSLDELKRIKSIPVDIQHYLPKINPGTRMVINRMLAIKPADRFESYEALLDALNDAATLIQSGGKLPLVKTRKFWVTAAAGVAIAAAVVTAVMNRPQEVEGDPSLFATNNDGSATDAQNQFIEARRLLTNGNFSIAADDFTKLIQSHSLQQPTLNWARINLCLAQLYQGKTSEAAAVLKEIQANAYYASGSAAEANTRFFNAITEDMLAPKALPVPAINRYRSDSMEAIGILLNGLRHWNDGNFSEAETFLGQFLKSTPQETVSWINDYKAPLTNVLKDIVILKSMVNLRITETMSEKTALGVIAEVRSQKERLLNKLVGEKLVENYVDSLKPAIAKIRSKEGREKLRQMDMVRAEEANLLTTLNNTIGHYARDYEFSRAISALKDTSFRSPEVKLASEDLLLVWENAAAFLEQLKDDIIELGYKGPILTRNQGNLYGRLLDIEEDNWKVRLYMDENALESSGDIDVPFSDIPAESLVRIAQRIATGISDSTDYFKRQEYIVCFCHVTGLKQLESESASTLMKELRSFRLLWSRVMEYQTSP